MKEIGGYFELELPTGSEYHKNAIRLNTGRNAFEYILRARHYKKVYIPYYTCDVMLEPILRLGIDFEYYSIDERFFPIFDLSIIKPKEGFLYTNYFGICQGQVEEVAKSCKNLIIDNSQAFFDKPLSGVDTFYSPRKFFGVSDGAYLYTENPLNVEFEKDKSYERCDHLLGRIDLGAEKSYQSFKRNDLMLADQPIKIMSNLTKRILESIDYDYVRERRRYNYLIIHEALKKSNKLKVDLAEYSVPMVYPYLVENSDMLRKRLIENRVFIATYWPNVLEWCKFDDMDYNLAKNILPLPIDQRCSKTDMNRIIEFLKLKVA